jgi:ankyrin repeat protein
MRIIFISMILATYAVFGSMGIAQERQCEAFGTKFFFETESSERVLECLAQIENKSQRLLDTTDPLGNLIPTNAVLAGADTVVLAGLLEALTKDDRKTVFSHRNHNNQTILHLAVGSPNAVQLITELGHFDIDANLCAASKDEWFWTKDLCDTPLHTAVSDDASFEVLQALLAIGANPDVPNRDGKFPVNISAKNDQETAKITLLQKAAGGLKFDKTPYNGKVGHELNAIFYLVKNSQDHRKLERLFQITNDGDHDNKMGWNKRNIAHWAAINAKTPEMFEVVMKNSQDFLCEPDSTEKTPRELTEGNPVLIGTTQKLDLINACP